MPKMTNVSQGKSESHVLGWFGFKKNFVKALPSPFKAQAAQPLRAFAGEVIDVGDIKPKACTDDSAELRGPSVLTLHKKEPSSDGRETHIVLENVLPTHGPSGVQIKGLAQLGLIAHDPGLTNTSLCESKISFVDGDKGALYHRGHAIEKLAEENDFQELSQLLIFGHLPSAAEKAAFRESLWQEQKHIPPTVFSVLNGFEPKSDPMLKLQALVLALGAQYSGSQDWYEPDIRASAMRKILAAMPVFFAACVAHERGEPYLEQCKQFESAAQRMLSVIRPEESLSEAQTQALDKLLLLHADHEQNASTTAVRLAGSTGLNPYGCVAAGIAALSGPLHGGANLDVINCLEQIQAPEDIQALLVKAKDKRSHFRLPGVGHRLYRNFDPRAGQMRKQFERLALEPGIDQKNYRKAQLLGEAVIKEEYFKQRKLYPNVDFYSSPLMHALGVSKTYFPAIFAVGRTPGWLAHWDEMRQSDLRIIRPRQIYTGEMPAQGQ